MPVTMLSEMQRSYSNRELMNQPEKLSFSVFLLRKTAAFRECTSSRNRRASREQSIRHHSLFHRVRDFLGQPAIGYQLHSNHVSWVFDLKSPRD